MKLMDTRIYLHSQWFDKNFSSLCYYKKIFMIDLDFKIPRAQIILRIYILGFGINVFFFPFGEG